MIDGQYCLWPMAISVPIVFFFNLFFRFSALFVFLYPIYFLSKNISFFVSFVLLACYKHAVTDFNEVAVKGVLCEPSTFIFIFLDIF
jgi:hypothetical protein